MKHYSSDAVLNPHRKRTKTHFQLGLLFKHIYVNMIELDMNLVFPASTPPLLRRHTVPYHYRNLFIYHKGSNLQCGGDICLCRDFSIYPHSNWGPCSHKHVSVTSILIRLACRPLQSPKCWSQSQVCWVYDAVMISWEVNLQCAAVMSLC